MLPSNHNRWDTLPGPDDITRVELPNGITLLTRPNFNSSAVVVTGYLTAGNLFDEDDKLGLAHFTALALMRGTQTQSFQEIYDALESSGASLGFGCNVHHASFWGRALSEDLPLLLKTISESIRHPTFPGEQIERLRGQILTALAIRAQDTKEMASLTFDEVLFSGHPYARPEDGYSHTIQNTTREDLIGFHNHFYGPVGMVLSIAGAVEPGRVIDEVQSTLGDWDKKQVLPQILPPTPRPEKTIRRHLDIPGKYQTDLVLGTVGPRRQAPDYLAASLGNNILGQFGLMGRIGDVVREQAGLAYHASTSLSAWLAGGSWEVNAGVNPANLEKATELIIQELERFVREPVTTEELQDSKSNFIGRLPLSLESNSGVASAMINIEYYQLGMDYYRRYPQLVEEITPEMVLETARRYIDPSKLCIISAG